MYLDTVTAENGNSIYLPMYSNVKGTSVPSGSSTSNGYYWSATESGQTVNYAYYLSLGTGNSFAASLTLYKYYRMLVRPVLVK